MRLMRDMRESIKKDKFEEFVQNFIEKLYKHEEIPSWVLNSLAAVNINLNR